MEGRRVSVTMTLVPMRVQSVFYWFLLKVLCRLCHGHNVLWHNQSSDHMRPPLLCLFLWSLVVPLPKQQNRENKKVYIINRRKNTILKTNDSTAFCQGLAFDLCMSTLMVKTKSKSALQNLLVLQWFISCLSSSAASWAFGAQYSCSLLVVYFS